MTDEEIRAFAARDWSLVEELKARFWAERKARLSAAQALATGDSLYRHARALRPDWPSAEERADDLATHVRVSACLQRVG